MSGTIDALGAARRFKERYGVAAVEASVLATVIEAGRVRHAARGELLCKEHEPAHEMWLLLEGRVRASRTDARGVDVPVMRFDAPAVLGHNELVEGSNRVFTLTVRTPSVLVSFDRARFEALNESPGPRGGALRHLLLGTMSERIEEAERVIRALIDPSVAYQPDDATDHGGNELE